jgi:hypothetical protein
MLHEKYKAENRSGNAINPISDRNKNKASWIKKAKNFFGAVL